MVLFAFSITVAIDPALHISTGCMSMTLTLLFAIEIPMGSMRSQLIYLGLALPTTAQAKFVAS